MEFIRRTLPPQIPLMEDPLIPMINVIVNAADARKATSISAFRISSVTEITTFMVIVEGELVLSEEWRLQFIFHLTRMSWPTTPILFHIREFPWKYPLILPSFTIPLYEKKSSLISSLQHVLRHYHPLSTNRVDDYSTFSSTYNY